MTAVVLRISKAVAESSVVVCVIDAMERRILEKRAREVKYTPQKIRTSNMEKVGADDENRTKIK